MVDHATRLLNAAINILFIGHPQRTALGVFVGTALNTTTKVFSPLLSRYSSWVDFTKISGWEYIIVGVMILHLPTIRFYLLKKGSMLSENEEKAFEIIRRAKKEGVPEWRIKTMYIELCEKVLENVKLKPATEQEIRDYLQQSQSTEQ